ncbi:MAG: hypothetical protein HYV13_02295 [Candidatus Doudnabacteria bacterium]|nr:hypothetical protein [Candidatus Doudnabacteria bacterium]
MMFAQIFVVVAILASAGVASAQTVFTPSLRIPGIGVERKNISGAVLDDRIRKIILSRQFWLLRQECAKDAPKRLFDNYWRIIEPVAAIEPRLDPYIIGALITLESCVVEKADNGFGPVGLCQIDIASGKDLGMKVHVERRFRLVPRKNSRGQILKDRRGRALARRVYYWYTYPDDERWDPAKCIMGMRNRLLRSYNAYGSMDATLAEYHMGPTRMNRLLSLYTGQNVVRNPTKKGEVAAKEVIAKRQLRYAKIFFDNTPSWRRSVWLYLKRLPDDSETYYFKEAMWEGLLRFYHDPRYGGGPAAYERLQARYSGASSPMWSFFTEEERQQYMIMTVEALAKAYDPPRPGEGARLVPLPQDPAFFGFRPRLEGSSPIGAKALKPQDRPYYIGSEASTLGALVYISYELRRLTGAGFRILETNSLVRDNDYQLRLRTDNVNARTSLPTHVMAKAFDLPYNWMSPQLRENLEFLLQDLAYDGKLTFSPESGSQHTDHVVPHPDAEEFFDKVYAGAERQLAARNAARRANTQ